MMRLTLFLLVSCLGFCALASGQTEIITTVAGNGRVGSSGDGGAATAAELNQPGGIAVDASGDLFIADTVNNRIREVSASGIITTVVGSGGLSVAGGLYQPGGVFVDASGNLFIADTGNSMVREVAAGSSVVKTVAGGGSYGFYGDGAAATAATLYGPQGVFVDASGNIFIADALNNRIREVSASSGNINTVAGNGTQGFAGDGGPATSAELNNPTGVFLDSSGNIYIADSGNNRIRKVSAGNITTIAGNGTAGYSGDGGPATSAELYLFSLSSQPTSVVVDASGNLFIAVTYSNRIREVSPGGTITTVAGIGTSGFYGDGGPATFALLNHPAGVAVDASGDLFIADTGNNRIREVSQSTVPPPSINPGGIVAVDSTVTTIQPGEWVSIWGTNLASSTATWTGNFPTSLGGTSVTIDGIAAYLSYVSPTQINLQVPNDTFTGSVPVVVTSGNQTATSTVTLAQIAPSFLLFDNKHVTGIILRPDGSGSQGGGAYDFLGPTGNSLGYPTVAAKAGDTVEIYALGLGPTTPPVPAGPAGETFNGQPPTPTTNAVNLLINSVNVTPSLLFTGLASTGLFQINMTIPAGLGTGDVPLIATVGGVQSQSGVVISLQ